MEDKTYKEKYDEYKEVFSSRKKNLLALLQEQLHPVQNAANIISSLGHLIVKCHHDKDDLVRASAFKALATEDLNLTGTSLVKVAFPNAIYDLAGEYDAATSTFIPKKSGVYVITASANYIKRPESQDNASNPFIFIRVNNGAQDIQDEFRLNPRGRSRSEVTQVTDNLFLNAGDRVEVFFGTDENAPGTIFPSLGTYFTAARVPSPIHKKRV